MKRLALNTILAGVVLAAVVLPVSGQTSDPVKINLSDKQNIQGVVLDGRPYIDLSELSRAISGKVQLAKGLKVEGSNLYTSDSPAGDAAGYLGTCKAKCMVTLSGSGLLSSNLVRVKGKDGAERILVPLDDLAKAMGGSVQSDAASRRFNVMGVGGAAGDAGGCKKCLLFLNPQGAMP
jgi:hypothetical protein